jgi:cysteine desulfurase
MREIYLDNGASTPPLPSVIAAMEAAMTESFGNPSSAHSRGAVARTVVEESRAAVAYLLGVPEDALVFTSGATEANNIALLSGIARSRGHRRLVTTSVEHSSVLKMADYLEGQGVDVVRLPVDRNGLVDMTAIERELAVPTSLLSIQWVNSETGVIQPIEQIAKIAQGRGVAFHVDAAQALGKLRLRVSDLPIDYASITAHKIHGPQGVGALYIRPGSSFLSLLHGGPQEGGRRAGTENVPGVVGFGKAARIRVVSFDAVAAQVRDLRDEFEGMLTELVPGVAFNGRGASRVYSTSNILFPGIDGQALVARLDQLGIYCSQSSACTNQRPEPSYVLRAMGLTEEQAYAGVRFTFSELITRADMRAAATAIADTVKVLLRFEGAGAFAA